MPSGKHARSSESSSAASLSNIHHSDNLAQPHPDPPQRSHSVGSSTHAGDSVKGNGSRKKVVSCVPRTGQACDRCKSRKIRCDDTPGGCLPCRQVNSDCKTTDRVTHKATARGHTESLERDNVSLREKVARLEQQLQSGSPRSSEEPRLKYVRHSSDHEWNYHGGQRSVRESSANPTNATATGTERADTRAAYHDHRNPVTSGPLPRVRLGSHLGENYFGVSPAADLGTVKGLALTVFNMTIDLGDCIPQASRDSLGYWMTYEAVTCSIEKQQHPHTLGVESTLPSTLGECCLWYGFWNEHVNPVFPLFNKPDFEAMLKRIYAGGKYTVAEDVSVRAVLGFLKLQRCLRNGLSNDEASTAEIKEALAHLHYCLGRYNDLNRSRTLADITAAVLLCCCLRTFPRPSASWRFMEEVLTAAIEMGLHRSNKAWVTEDSEQSIVEIEQRKRVFWSLCLIYVVLSGRLGRPMRIRCEDYDIEIPEALNENHVKAKPGTGPQDCTFYISIEYFKLTELFFETYSKIHAVRPSPHSYETTVHELDWKFRNWKRNLPPILAETSDGEGDYPPQARMFGLWLACWSSELLLLIHHPGLCKSKSPDVLRHNIQVSGEAAAKLIHSVMKLWTNKAYDTTWYSLTTFFTAILTRLFIVAEYTDPITGDDLSKLEVQNEECMNIVGEIGDLLGSGTGERLRTRMEQILSQGVERIKQKLLEQKPDSTISNGMTRRLTTKSPLRPQDNSQTSSTQDNVARPSSSNGTYRGSEQLSTLPQRSHMYRPSTDAAGPHHAHPHSSPRPGSWPSPRPGSYPSPHYPAYPSPRSGNYPSPRHGSFPSPRYAPYPMPYPPQMVPPYHFVYPPDPHLYGVPHSTTPDPYLLSSTSHPYGTNYDGQMAWKQWLESAGRNDQHDYMPASALVTLSGHDQGPAPTSHEPYGGPMHTNRIPMPGPETHNSIPLAPQEWLVSSTYDPPRYSVLPDGTVRKSDEF